MDYHLYPVRLKLSENIRGCLAWITGTSVNVWIFIAVLPVDIPDSTFYIEILLVANSVILISEHYEHSLADLLNKDT